MIKPGDEYRFLYGEPGLFLEMYVPKQYECFVRQTMETALKNHEEVKSYLSEHMLDVQKFLGKDERQAKDLDNKHRIASIQQVLKGYSVYSGDGVFLDSENPSRFIRDAVVVFRIMFLPDFLDKEDKYCKPADEMRFAARRYLRYWTHDMKRFLETTCLCGAGEKQLIDDLSLWLDDIHFFMYGYVLYNLCEEIIRREENDQPEEEIWIGSFRCLAVNRIMRIPDPKETETKE